MLITDINANVEKYNEGIAQGFSVRLIICVSIAVLVMLLLILVLPSVGIPMEISGVVGGIPAVFIAALGFIKREGWYLDEIIKDKFLRYRCFRVDFESDQMEELIRLSESGGKDAKKKEKKEV